MRQSFTKALEAFDREVLVLTEVARAYDAFLDEVCTLAQAALTDSGLEAAVDAGDAPHGRGLLASLPGAMGVTLQTWASAPYGGPPGRLRLAIILAETLPVGLPSRAELHRAADAALAAEPPVERRLASDPDLVGADILAWTDVDLSDPDLHATLSARARAWAGTLRVVDTAIRSLRVPAMEWLQQQVKRLRDPVRLPGFSQKGNWEGGPYAQAKVPGLPDVWVTALPGGTLGFHWQAKPTAESSARVYAALRQYTPSPLGGYAGVVLIDADEVAELSSADDEEGLLQKVLAAVRTYDGAAR